MNESEVKQYEYSCGHIFSGLQMFVRDTFLENDIEEKYIIGKIIREPTFCDVSARVGALLTTHRFAILSNRFVDIGYFEHGTNWGLHVCKRNSYFKIIDVFKIEDKTQISLLHLDENWKLFENNSSNVEEDIIKMSQERFNKKVFSQPIPELASKRWLERLINPLGINMDKNYISLEIDKNIEGDQETLDAIKNMDNIIEKALVEIELRNKNG